MTFTCSLILSAAIATSGAPAAAPAWNPEAPATPAIAYTALDTSAQLPAARPLEPRVERWMLDRGEQRPAALPLMYVTLGALQGLDIYSTRRALSAGAHEANPLMQEAAGNSGAMLAVKALSTAGTIYFVERAWKKNRKGAVITMALINGAMAAIATNNLRNARR